MLSAFTLTEPLCINVPFELNYLSIACEGNDIITNDTDKIFAGILNDTESKSNYICKIDNETLE